MKKLLDEAFCEYALAKKMPGNWSCLMISELVKIPKVIRLLEKVCYSKDVLP